MRKSKDNMIIGDWKQIFNSCFNPFPSGDPLAFGAVSVSAGIKIRLSVAAFIAPVDMITEL